MDSLLPHCTNLEHLYVSASEISIHLFTLVPPSLRTIKIQAFNVSTVGLARVPPPKLIAAEK